MSLLEIISKAKTHLQMHGRVSLRVLKLEFELNDDQTELPTLLYGQNGNASRKATLRTDRR